MMAMYKLQYILMQVITLFQRKIYKKILITVPGYKFLIFFGLYKHWKIFKL